MDSPQAPLISEEQRQGELQYEAEDADAASVASKGETKPGAFVLLLTFAAGISGLLFGCWFPKRPRLKFMVLTQTRRYRCHISDARLDRNSPLRPHPYVYG